MKEDHPWLHGASSSFLIPAMLNLILLGFGEWIALLVVNQSLFYGVRILHAPLIDRDRK